MKPILVATPEDLAQLLKVMSSLVTTSTPVTIVNGAAESDVLLLAPSILNEDLQSPDVQNVTPLLWVGALAFSAGTKFYTYEVRKLPDFSNNLAALRAGKLSDLDIDGDGQVDAPKMLTDDNYLPGDLGFDPLGLFKGTDEHKRTMQLKEINNGPLDMVSITAYVINETATKMPVFTVTVPAKLSISSRLQPSATSTLLKHNKYPPPSSGQPEPESLQLLRHPTSADDTSRTQR
jgi:hypothetical protein